MTRPAKPTRALALWLLFWLPWAWNGVGCVAPPRVPEDAPLSSADSPAGRQAECVPEFPDQNGWYGGDAAYSIPLPMEDDRVSLWLFGDSFVARRDAPGRRSYPFVHNSIGLSRCEAGGEWSLETFWQIDEGGSPRAFVEPDPAAEWVQRATRQTGAAPYYWLFDGFVAHDVLFVGLLRVVRSAPRGPFNLPFRVVGVDLARIENYRDPPREWRIQLSILSESPIAFPASAFALSRRHLHAFAFFDQPDGRAPRMLSRLDLAALRAWRSDLSDSLETWTDDSTWEAGFDPEGAMIVMNDDATEMSVHFESATESWIAVYSDPRPEPDESAASGIIWLRSAERLEGPWSEPRALFTIPETLPDALGRTEENLFCYAGKAHPQFSRANRLLLTYVCNVYARNPSETGAILRRLRESPSLYRAKAVSVALPALPALLAPAAPSP